MSGFLIGTIFLKTFSDNSGLNDLVYFWKRRWWRTLPNYYLFILINFVGFSLLKDDFSFDWRYLVFLQNLTNTSEGFFSVSWSLAIEEWFYLTVPLIYLMAFRISKSKSIAIFSTFSLIIIGSLLVRYHYITSYGSTWNGEIRSVAILRLDSLIYGVMGAWLWIKRREYLKKLKFPLFLIGLFLIGIGIFIRNSPLLNQEPLMLLFLFPIISLGISCWLPFLSCWTLREDGQHLPHKWIKNISLWSYSLYLVHVPAMEGFRIFILPKIWDDPFLQVLTFVSWLLVAIFASFAIYRFFEKPFTDLRDGPPDSGWIRSKLSLRAHK